MARTKATARKKNNKQARKQAKRLAKKKEADLLKIRIKLLTDNAKIIYKNILQKYITKI